MNQDKLKEHLAKETLKQLVDSSPNYSEKMRQDLKAIIDVGKDPSEILRATLAYFSVMRFF